MTNRDFLGDRGKDWLSKLMAAAETAQDRIADSQRGQLSSGGTTSQPGPNAGQFWHPQGPAEPSEPHKPKEIVHDVDGWNPKTDEQYRLEVRCFFTRFYERAQEKIDGIKGKNAEIDERNAPKKSYRLILGWAAIAFASLAALALLRITFADYWTAATWWPVVQITGGLSLGSLVFRHFASVPEPHQKLPTYFFPPTGHLEKVVQWYTENDLARLYASGRQMMAIENAGPSHNDLTLVTWPNRDQMESPDKTFWGVRKGQSGQVFHTPRALIMMTFTDTQIISYQGCIDLITGEILYEHVREFFYQDVTSVSRQRTFIEARPVRSHSDVSQGKGELQEEPPEVAESARRPVAQRDLLSRQGSNHEAPEKKKKELVVRETFRFDLTDGDRVVVTVKDGYVTGDDALYAPPTLSEERMAMIRRFVRDKKRAQIAPGEARLAAPL